MDPAVNTILVLLGLLYANFLEWSTHRWVLHGRHRAVRWFRSFHFGEHHRVSRKNAGCDPSYVFPWRIWSWSARTKEVFSLGILGLLHLPLWWVSPWFMVGATSGMVLYYCVHTKVHNNISWGQKWVPWHLDHHLGPDQNKNWNVTIPIFDHLLGTRVAIQPVSAENSPHE